jgi:hypothetical protein
MRLKKAYAIANRIFFLSSKFKNGNPTVYMYYVTTGKWTGDQNLTARADTEVADLLQTGNFKGVYFNPVGADQIQKLYNQFDP